MDKINILIILVALLWNSCSKTEKQEESTATVFVGAKLIDGTGAEPIDNGVMLIDEGRILEIGKQAEIDIPDNAEIIDISGKTIMPGIINAHGHVGMTSGLQWQQYSRENVERDLALGARYGVTAIVSLGGDGEPSIEIRNNQNTPNLTRSRLYVAGTIVTGDTPETVKEVIDYNKSIGVDFIKIRVDGPPNSPSRMSEEIYSTVIDYSHSLGLRVASHIFYLNDAKGVLKAGTDFIAHSVRDQSVDDDFISLMKETGVYYCATFMRDVSVFVYESEPDFFSDPFFLEYADSDILDQLLNPERQQGIQNDASAQGIKVALDTGIVNLRQLSKEGIPIVMGTDSGPPGRFIGYFEHKEMEMMVNEVGMTPMQVIVSATGASAKALKLDDIGTLERGKWADFIILDNNPLQDITNTQSIYSVWIAGNKVPDK